MLKLEKASREGISIILRDKEHVFTKPLWIAFAIACTIHFALLLLFHITPISYETSQTVFPPIRAEAASEARESAVADIKPFTPTIRGLPEPHPSRPQPSNMPQFLMIRPMEQIAAGSAIPVDSHQLETSLSQPSFHPLVKQIPDPFFIAISGCLAEYPFQISGFEERVPPSTQAPICLVYAVMVEKKTGKIFWFESAQHVNVTLTKFAEEVLREMTFSLDSTLAVVSGQVELHFNPGNL